MRHAEIDVTTKLDGAKLDAVDRRTLRRKGLLPLARRDASESFDQILVREDEFYVRGRDNGNNADLEVAIKLARLAVSRASDAVQRGEAYDRLGQALAAQGECESDPTLLRQAVEAFRAALKEYTRERAPLDWARMQNTLGNALASLGERESDSTLLRQAVEAYCEALKERTRVRMAGAWAMTQNNLGVALASLGEREIDPARLRQAVEAYRAALEVRTRESVPLSWATTQNNLGAALFKLGKLETDPVPLRQAVDAFRAALEERTRECVPLDWAMTQNNLSVALSKLGELETDPAVLLDFVEVYRAARDGRTGERGTRTSDPLPFRQAVDAYREALKEYTRERVPYRWAQTSENMAIAFLAIYRLAGEDYARTEALAAADDAIVVYRDAQSDYYIAKAEALRAQILAATPAP